MRQKGEEKLRVWWIRNVPNKPTLYPVSSIKEALAKLGELEAKDLTDSSITSNAGGLEELVDGEWEEYYDEVGRNIDEIWEAYDKAYQQQLVALHVELCPNCPWDGETIFSGKEAK